MTGLGIILTAGYIPGWTGAAILTGFIALSIMLPFYLFRRIEMGLGHWLGLIFLTYASLSILWAPVWQQAVWDLWIMWILGFCFCLGASECNLKKLWIGMALGLVVSDCVAVAQWFDYGIVFNNNSPNAHTYAGTYVNPDMFGETACLITIALIITGVYWPLILTVPPIYFTHSRSVYAAYATVIAFALWQRYRWLVLMPCLIILLAVGWAVTRNTSDRPYMSDSIAERLAIWQDTLDGVSLRGLGAGSFFMLYPEFAKRTDTMATRPEDPHNEFLNLAFEYGLGSIPVLLLLALGLSSTGPERYILVAFLTIAFFSFPSRIPTEGFIGMVALGRLCSRRNLAWIKSLPGRPFDVARQLRPSSTNSAVESVYPYKVGI